MKKVLWIACLLCLMPFLGYAQTNASLAMQDDEEIFGQAPVSKELPAHIQLNVAKTGNNTGTPAVWAHAMYVPEKGSLYGRYYEVLEDGTVNQLKMYNDWYYSSAEYYYKDGIDHDHLDYKVWAYAEDYVKGFMYINLESGSYVDQNNHITLNMADMTYDYNGDRMLGVKNGRIYIVNLFDQEPDDDHPNLGPGSTIADANGNETLYDYADYNGIKPIAIACDLDGTIYFVSTSLDGDASSSLYKLEPNDDGTLDLTEIGDLGWPAQRIQTMAFNHNTRELFWFACDKQGNTQLKKLDKETAAILWQGEMLQTEISGLIFEFDYRPYTATCINQEGTLLLDNNETVNTYLPGKDVTVTITPPDCKSFDSLWVMKASDHNEILYVFHEADLTNGAAVFAMPACDVDINAAWVGNQHGVTLTWTPNTLTNALTKTGGNTALCGNTVNVKYARPDGYYLKEITATYNRTEVSLPLTINAAQSKVSFTMPDYDVTVNAVYEEIPLEELEDICQYKKLTSVGNNNLPIQQHVTGTHTHTYTFAEPSGTEHYYTNTNTTTTNAALDQTIADLTFDIAGTWNYSVLLTNNFGDFSSETLNFEVYSAPESITIEGNHYCCEGDSIELNVVPVPADAVMNGNFQWKKGTTQANGQIAWTNIEGATEATYKKYDIHENPDAGIYSVEYTPVIDNPTAVIEAPCEFEPAEGFMVNIASLPNDPTIHFFEGENPICYRSSVMLEWEHGVLNPEEYEFQWFIVPENAVDESDYVEIDGETDASMETEELTENTTYAVRINYAGDYFLCHKWSEPFTVEVNDSISLDIMGDMETCQGINPETNPYIDNTEEIYSNFAWSIDGVAVGETSNELHLDNTTLNGNHLGEAKTLNIEVSAENNSGCTIYGEFEFVVKELPNVYILNNQTSDTAFYNDDPTLTITVCKGTLVQLTAYGADGYRWDPSGSEGPVYNIQAMENMTCMVSGYSQETGCWGTTSIQIAVIDRPEITWVVPAKNPEEEIDTTFSMITNNFQLKATPEGGIFSYVIWGDPEDTDYPIPDGIFNPSELGIGEYLLVYSYQNEAGCDAEERIRISIEKPYWTDPDQWDPEWMENCLTTIGRYEIANPAQMGSFMAYVYGLNDVEKKDFAGDTIWITDNIDMREKPNFYRPFCDTADFKGVIDGTGKMVKNITILENDLMMNHTGYIRNIGFQNAMITSIGNPCTIDVVETGRLHNSYITMPELENVSINLNPTGEVRNVYYYDTPIADDIFSVYMDNRAVDANGDPDPVYEVNVTPEWLLTNASSKNTFGYEGPLEEWVWLMNDFYYRTWKTDADEEEDWENYGYPYHETAFVHHHYVEVLDPGCGTMDYELTGVERRTIKDVEYVYAMNDSVVTVTFTPSSDYVIYDSIVYTAVGYNGIENNNISNTVVGGEGVLSFSFHMPIDSIYLPAYYLEIQPYARKSYWTDEGNYDEEWFQDCVDEGRFEIGTNKELAAFARKVIFDGYNFAGDTIHIKGAVEESKLDTPADYLLDMSGHYWMPVNGFEGVLNGTKYIVDNLYIDENCENSRMPFNAMFVNSNCSIINMGLQDIVLPEGDNKASYIYNDGPNYNASVINSFATTDPAKHLQIELAVGEGVTVTNSYTLDEGGNMIDHNHDGTNFLALRNWVIEQSAITPHVWWDWKLDDLYMNYDYPVHSGMYDGGYPITYVPDILTPDNDCYVSGPATGLNGNNINVGVYPDWCWDLTSLTVDYGDSVVDIMNAQTFVMPDKPVTVTGTFAPKNWTLTVNHKYLTEDGELLYSKDYPNKNNNDVIDINYYIQDVANVPQLVEYEPLEEMENDTMSCGNKTITILYQGRLHNIEFDCDFADCGLDPIDNEFEVEITTDPADEAHYRETVTVTVTVTDGENVSITGLIIKDAECNDVPYTGSNGTYTFEMPAADVKICAIPEAEYWDGWGIADISWFVNKENDDTYTLTTDSMLGGLAALVSGREWLFNPAEGEWLFDSVAGSTNKYYTEEQVNGFNFAGKTIIIESAQEDNEINLIEHIWRPIGAQIEFNKQFQGTFDGNGQKITNMRSFDPTGQNEQFNGACQGLFGTVGQLGVVTDVNIQGTAEGRYFTAGVAAINNGVIMNCVADVQVKSEFQAGGLVCNNYGYLVNSYCISDHIECLTADFTKDNPTNNYYVGGLASFNDNNGQIINCHSVATLVKGNGNNPIHYYGQLVGMDLGYVGHCYYVEDPTFKPFGTEGSEFLGTAEDCAVMGGTTSANMTATSLTLPEIIAEYYTEILNETWNEELVFFAWTDGEEGYPVYDRTNSKAIMSVNGNELNVVLYPNPTKDIVNIASDNIQRVSVYNMFGQMVIDTEVNGNETTINMNGFAAGVYMVRITTTLGVATRNIIVE